MKCAGCGNPIHEYPKQIGLKTIHDNEKCRQLLIDKHVKKVQKERMARDFKPKTSPKKLTQDVFNKFIRVRDTRPNGTAHCISCSALVELGTKNCQAGHYKSVGSRDDLRYNELNCHVQCLKCNKFGGVDVGIKYRDNLKRKIGLHKVHELEDKSLIEKQDYSEKALKALRKKYAKMTRDMLSEVS